MVRHERAEIRDRMLTRRRAVPPDAADRAGHQIASGVMAAFHAHLDGGAGVVAAYQALPGEIDPAPAVSLLHDCGWRIVLPVCGLNGRMDFCPWSPGDALASGRFGVREPTTSPVPITEVDAVIVPGVAFDRSGNRLGHGVGFYDRFFDRCAQQSHHPYRLGVSYDFQIVDLPAPEAWDIAMHLVVSPSEVIDTSSCE